MKQYSGNEHGILGGIGLISCVYVNPETEQFWVMDYRLYDPDTAGKDQHQHVSEMYDACFERYLEGELDFREVLMDIWYATTKLIRVRPETVSGSCLYRQHRAYRHQ